MFRRDYRQVAELHVQSGWVPAHTRIEEFESAVRTVCEPIFEKPLKDISFGQVLISLFRTARRFDMEVQPQLILLEKTLLNIEGLGRQLYPELDLWTTAHPYLERWLKNRFHPKTLWSELKRYSPEWMEKFPQVPQLIFNGLQQLQTLSELAPELHAAAQQLQQQKNHYAKQQRRRFIALLALGSALAIAWPTIGEPLTQGFFHFPLGDIPASSYVLLAIAATALLFKR
jgi:ubiquinone biosynthesis protein